ncbi:MAG TPA: NAD-dependent epimerase/dehydratase family protein [Anaerolineales bacterium]|nr:NAD-dependent epimerase/dehydratase family protein [Anaerolineales bacterium]
MRVLVVGATGVLGRNVIPRLLERGHQVRAVVRRNEQARFLNAMGAEAVLGNVLDAKGMTTAARGIHIGLHLATAFPENSSQDWSLKDRIRLEGTRNLLDALIKNGAQHYVQQSITLVYGEQGEEIVDETAPSQATPINQSAIEMEAMVRDANLGWTILRGGLFYGPGTGREESWWQAARHGRMTIPGDGSDLISLVHVVDMARAVVAATEHMPTQAGSTYNIVDNEPVRMKDLFRYVSAQASEQEPRTGGPRLLPSLGVRNVRAQIELNWRPVFPNYQIGLAYAQPEGIENSIQRMASPRAADHQQTEAIL